MNNNLDELVKEAPSLTLTPFTEEEPQKQPLVIEDEQPEVPQVVLTPEEQKMVDAFAAQIDITNTQMVMQYGAGSQKKIADFSESALNNVRTKDMGEIGQMLTDVVTQLKDFDEPEERDFLGSLKKAAISWKI